MKPNELPRLISELQRKVALCPLTRDRPVQLALWVPKSTVIRPAISVLTADVVFGHIGE
jgi:hypothetical protein